MVSPVLSVQSSVHAGEGVIDSSQRTAAREQSPSLGAKDRQRSGHKSQDTMKKTSPANRVARSKDSSQPSSDKERDSTKQKKQATAKLKPMSRGGFDAYWEAQGGEQAGPSHEDWPALQPASGTARVKRAAPSQSLKKVATKAAHQIQAQQRIQQQALQPAPVRVFLLSAPAGTPKPFEMTKKSLAAGIDEWEHLNQETRAAQALFTQYGQLGMAQAVLMQPVQVTGIVEPPMPWIRPDELRLRNAGVSLKEQAMAQNLIYFVQR